MLAPNTEVESVLKLGAGKRRFALLRRPVFWVGVAIVAVAAAWWWSQGSASTTVTYVTAPVTRGGLIVTVTATGTVEPINQVEVGSELSGTIRAVNVDYNDPVKVGDVLATIDTDKLLAQANRTRAQLEAAGANVVQAEATLKEADQNLRRLQPLAEQDYSSRQSLQAAEANYNRAVAALDSVKAQVKVATADLALTETDLAKAEIRSPIGGVVLSRNVDPGQTVAASLQAPVLFTIAEDLAKMNLLVDVDEADAGDVKEGLDAEFTVEAYGERKFPARVLQLRYAPQTINGVVTYKAVLSVDNSSLTLRPGMTATAAIVVKRVNTALLVPNAALRFSPAETTADTRSLFQRLMPRPVRQATTKTMLPEGQKRVYVLRDGAPVEVLFTPGVTDGSSTEVVKGDLAEGDLLITDATTAQ